MEWQNVQCFVTWLCEHNLFSKLPELSLLPTSVVVNENINCDEVFEVGAIALTEIKGNIFSDISLKRKYAVKSLATIIRAVAIHNNSLCMCVWTQTSFYTIWYAHSKDLRAIARNLQVLCILYEAGQKRKESKSSMVKVLLPKANESSASIKKSAGVLHIIDGGHLDEDDIDLKEDVLFYKKVNPWDISLSTQDWVIITPYLIDNVNEYT